MISTSRTVTCTRSNLSLTTNIQSCIIVLDPTTQEYHFCSIENIVHIQNLWLVLTKKLCVLFHPHFNAYSVVSKCLEFEAMSIRDINFPSLPIKTIRCVKCISSPFASFIASQMFLSIE